MPASRASSTTCWISGRSTTVSISFGIALVAGRNRVPSPATGKIALRIGFMWGIGRRLWKEVAFVIMRSAEKPSRSQNVHGFMNVVNRLATVSVPHRAVSCRGCVRLIMWPLVAEAVLAACWPDSASDARCSASIGCAGVLPATRSVAGTVLDLRIRVDSATGSRDIGAGRAFERYARRLRAGDRSGMERRIRRLRSSADAGRRDPSVGGEFPALSAGLVSGGGQARRQQGDLRRL